MKINKILILTMLLGMSLQGFSQEATQNVTGFVLDRWGNPVSGALVTVNNNQDVSVSTDKEGKFIVSAGKEDILKIEAPDQSVKTVDAVLDKPMNIVMGFSNKATGLPYELQQTVEESTSSVAITSNEQFNKRSANSIGNSLYGSVPGLTVLGNSGMFWEKDPDLYIRGLQTSSNSKPVIMIDGVEREIHYLSPDEVENVVVLKDAAAIALYGYKGINGVVNIVTKRGKYNTREVNFSYDHAINWNVRKPEFVDAHTYASAMNEALGYEGSPATYSQKELDAYKNGQYPYYYPNVNWMDETFRNTGHTNLYHINFRGGGQKFRYFTAVNLHANSGFIKNPDTNDGYSTQEKYSKANLRTNLDIDLTPKTKLIANIFGSLAETSRPGQWVESDDDKQKSDLWDMVYSLPSAAIPMKLESGVWGGNSTWSGEKNPVAQSQGAAYTKGHVRALFADLTLRQDLSAILPGLGGAFQLAYDNSAWISEDHSKTYIYNAYSTVMGEDGVPTPTLNTQLGKNSEMGSEKESTYKRNFNFYGNIFYNQTFGLHSLYSQLKWNYEYRDFTGKNNSFYRQSLSFYAHYGYKGRYYADLNVIGSASNRLAPGKRWGVSPTVSAAWVLSKEDFMEDFSFVNFLKLRASFGIISTDEIPRNSKDEQQHGYWQQAYSSNGLYSFTETYTKRDIGAWTPGRLASENPKHEKAYKYNFGLDATLFNNSLDITMDGYYNRRSDIWVDGSGRYSSVLGFDAPYVNGGIVDSWGVELGADYHKQIGNVRLTGGANFALAKNKVKDMYEEPKAYPWLEEAGYPLKQMRGLVALGLFKDQAEIDNSPVQSFGTIYPGDIKYKDMNGDNIIDDNDKVAIGHSTEIPEIFYSFHLGAEWKGLGFDLMFQGTGRYSAMLDMKALYRPIMNSTSLSQYYYDNRWTPNNVNAALPRLTTQKSENNYRESTFWLKDRSFLKLRNVEVYYNLPQTLLQKTKIVNRAKLYVRGIDLLCFDKIDQMDPEAYKSSTPITKSVVFGLTVGF